MTPNKSIPSFCFESPWLKPFDLSTEFVEVNTVTRVTPTWAQALIDMGINELMDVEPLSLPQGNLFYFDYNYGPVEEPIVYDDGSWSMSNTFDGVIGIKSEIKQHTLI